jgi:siroheme synthase-like protein
MTKLVMISATRRAGRPATGPEQTDRVDRPARAPLYPAWLVLRGRPCLVVGAGPVAARKVAGLLAADARVTVVAPEIHESVAALAGSGPGAGDLRLFQRGYSPGEAASYRLVVTATGRPEVDRSVTADAEAAGVFVNSADASPATSFLVPAVYRQGPVTVGVSTAGASPALAAWLRDRVAEALGSGLGAMAALMEEGRHRLQGEGLAADALDWEALLGGPFPSLVQAGDLDAARAVVEEAVSAAFLLRGGPP